MGCSSGSFVEYVAMGLTAIVLNSKQIEINKITTLCPMKVDLFY